MYTKSFICSLLIYLTSSEICANRIYTVPKPEIEVLYPKGLKVSIPDEDGIQLFAFHGNINKPMYHLEAGQYSRDILRKQGDRWVFYDEETQLSKGDVIYFWLFVIKDKLGFRYDNGRFVVEDNTNQQISFNLQQPNSNNAQINTPEQEIDVIANITETVSYLYKELADMKETNAILKDLVEKCGNAGLELRLTGVLPEREDAMVVAQNIVSRKLNVHVQVVKAVRTENKAIKFEVGSLQDKVTVIKAAKEKLKESRIVLTY